MKLTKIDNDSVYYLLNDSSVHSVIIDSISQYIHAFTGTKGHGLEGFVAGGVLGYIAGSGKSGYFSGEVGGIAVGTALGLAGLLVGSLIHSKSESVNTVDLSKYQTKREKEVALFHAAIENQ